MKLAFKYSLLVVEDAAQAFLSKYKGKYLGTIGHLGCFSFHYTKNISSGEGGALLINREEFIDRALIIWEKGTNRFDFLQGKVDKYHWVDIGSSFVPNEAMCSLLWGQILGSDWILTKRKHICNVYAKLLKPLTQKTFQAGKIRTTLLANDNCGNGHIFWVLFPTVEMRKRVQNCLELKAKLYTHYLALHSAPAAKKYARTHC